MTPEAEVLDGAAGRGPVAQRTSAGDVDRLGWARGVVLVHPSLSKLGWVAAGA